MSRLLLLCLGLALLLRAWVYWRELRRRRLVWPQLNRLHRERIVLGLEGVGYARWVLGEPWSTTRQTPPLTSPDPALDWKSRFLDPEVKA